MPERLLTGRKYFAAFLLDETFYFHGGIDSNGRVMDEFIELDMSTLIWKNIDTPKKEDGEKIPRYKHISADGALGHCYGHKMCIVTYRRSFVTMKQLGDVDFGQVSHSIDHEGIYMFGGVFGRTASEQKLNNKMMFYPIGQESKHRWKVLETKGVDPEGRFHHGMYYYEKGNYVIIFGGRRFAHPEPTI